jgi:phosphopantothenoylcysteine decarboxylase/phosphopantothenate--cysteine ligase
VDRIDGKRRRDSSPWLLELVPNPDIIGSLAADFPKAKVVGFAAEPGPNLDFAAEKLRRKRLWGIAVNDVGNTQIGFDSDENELTLLMRDGSSLSSGRASKLGCALWLLQALAER